MYVSTGHAFHEMFCHIVCNEHQFSRLSCIGFEQVTYFFLGHENISTAILPLPLIQEEQLSVTGERMCTKYW